MTRTSLLKQMTAAVAAAAVLGLVAGLQAQQQPKTGSLGSVKIAKDVMANGQRLAAGTYTVRLTGEQGKSVVGQTPEESQWVEFVQGTEVKGREVAIALSSPEAKKVLKSGPSEGGASAELLRGGDYIRVRLSRAGTRYLVHLPVATK
jgi:hypothetical protein